MRTVRARGLGIAFAVCGFAGVAGFAQAQSDSPSPCAAITDDKSRLQCYDAEAALRKGQSARPSTAAPASPPAAVSAPAPIPAPSAAARPAPSASSAPSSAAPTTAPASRAAESAPAKPAATSGSADTEFGSETLPKKPKQAGEAEQATEITAKVASISGQRKGDYRVTLDNGQVWAETQRTGGEPPAVGDTVTLRRGAMGSYFLSHGEGLALRVRRVK